MRLSVTSPFQNKLVFPDGRVPVVVSDLEYSVREQMYSVRFFPGVKHSSRTCGLGAQGNFVAYENFDMIKNYVRSVCLCSCQQCREAVITYAMNNSSERLSEYLLVYNEFIQNAGKT